MAGLDPHVLAISGISAYLWKILAEARFSDAASGRGRGDGCRV